MNRKCKHGPLWSLCFEEAKAKGRFSEECIVNIFEDMFLWFKKRNHGEAEDLGQKFYLKLSNSYHAYNRDRDKSQKKDGKAYVYAIARNVYIEHCKKNRQCPRPIPDINIAGRGGNPVRKAIAGELRLIVNKCLDSIPAEQRLVTENSLDGEGVLVGKIQPK